jgi:hypothetical protein
MIGETTAMVGGMVPRGIKRMEVVGGTMAMGILREIIGVGILKEIIGVGILREIIGVGILTVITGDNSIQASKPEGSSVQKCSSLLSETCSSVRCSRRNAGGLCLAPAARQHPKELLWLH